MLRDGVRSGPAFLRAAGTAAAIAFTAITCDRANVLGPVGVNDLRLEWLGDSLLVIGSRVEPNVRITQDGATISGATLQYDSDHRDIVAISAGRDSLLPVRLGRAQLTIRMGNSLFPESGTSWRQTVEVVLRELQIDRAALTLTSVGDTATLRAFPLDAAGAVVDADVQWISTDSNKVAVSGGRLTARGTGSTEVLAVVGHDTARSLVTVEQRLAQFVLSPQVLTLRAVGEQGTIVAQPVDNTGAPVPGVTPFWESGDASVVRVDNEGRVTAFAYGATVVYAFKGPVRSSVPVEVRQRAARVVFADGSPVIRSLGDTLRLSAAAYDADGVLINQPSRMVWTSLNAGVASVDRGLVNGLARGFAVIVAAMDSVADSVVVEIRNEPATIVVAPADTTLRYVSETALLRATVLNARGGVIADTSVTWSSADSTRVGVDATGFITGRGETGGTKVRVTAAIGPVTGFSMVGVSNQATWIDILPTVDSLVYLGQSGAPAVDFRNVNGDPLPRTSALWQSDRPLVVSVDAAGTIVARDTGTAYIKALSGSLRDSVLIVVRNDPGSIVASAVADTLTRPGQQVTYTAVILNRGGAPLNGYSYQWRSDNTGVATVAPNGTVTITGNGTARIIAFTSALADTVSILVTNLTMVHVDNGSSASLRIGTRARPYVSLATALANVDPRDTVMVHPGVRSYPETMSLAGQISVIGNDSASRANGNDPARLPVLSHDVGGAAITIASGASVLLRNLTIRHSVDGPAVDADGAGVRIENVHVNPGQSFRVGRGFRVLNSSGTVIADSRVTSVTGYGILFGNVTSGTISRVSISGVDPLGGTNGSGIEILRGSAARIELSAVRVTAGPRIFLDETAGATLIGDTLAGRHQLIQVRRATGATSISGSVFDLRQLAGDGSSSGSAADGRSGLEILESSDVSITGSTFTEPGGNAMDAIRLIDARGPAGGAAISNTRFIGGRHAIRSARSTWSLTNSSVDGAFLALMAEETDTLTLTSDTLRNSAGKGCVDARGVTSVTLVGGLLASCTASTADSVAPALTVRGIGAVVTVRNARFAGANQTAIDFVGTSLTLQNTVFSGTGTRTISAARVPAAISATASNVVEMTGNTIENYTGLSGARLSTVSLRFETNRVVRQRRGLVLASFAGASVTSNDFADQELAALENESLSPLSAPRNWWGDGRGPRRTSAPDAAGDSVLGAVTVDPLGVTPSAIGVTEDSLRRVRGDGQAGPAGTTLPARLVVRVVDTQGRPVPGIQVQFRVVSGGGTIGGLTSVNRTSDASGLAEVSYTLGATPGQNVVEAAMGNGSKRRTLNFTVTGQ